MSALNIRSNFIWLLALLLGCGSAPGLAEGADSGPLEIIDALGRRVMLSAPPQRIVTIFSSNTELVAALGLGDYIVGIDAMTYYPLEIAERAKIGGRLGISLEQVVARQPDLVLMTPARQAVHSLLSPLEKLKIPTVVLTSRTVADIMQNLEKVAILTGVPETGQKVRAEMETRFAAVRDRRQGRPRPKVVLITGRLSSGLFMTARKGSYTADIVELAGGTLALEEDATLKVRLPLISPEALLAVDPDIIIYTRRRGEGTAVGKYLQRPSFSTLKAQRNNNIYDVPSSEFLIPAPRVADGVERLAVIYEQWEKK